MVVIATLFAFVSCSGNFFTGGSVSSRPETSDSTTVDTGNKGLPSDVNFNISYVEADAIKPTSTTEVIAKVRPSVLELYCIVGQSKSSGSGVIVSFDDTDDNGTDDKALILTCHHVIENASQMTAKSIYGKEYKAELIGADPVSDIAILWITATEDNSFEGLTAAQMMCDSDKLLIGADVLAIGNPLGELDFSMTNVPASPFDRSITTDHKQKNDAHPDGRGD